MGDANRVQLSYIAESTFGTAVAGSPLQTLRYTGESLAGESTFVTSNEIEATRQVNDVIRTSLHGAGDINGELTAGTYDDMFAALLQTSLVWSTRVAVGPLTTISAASADQSFNDSANGFGSLVVGQWVYVSGFVNAANNGVFKIVTKTAGKITVSGGTLVVEAAGPSVKVDMGGQILNGTTFTSFNIEKKYSDIATTLALMLGMSPNTGQIGVSAEQIVTCGFGFMGKKETSLTTSNGSGYTAATTNPTMEATDHVVAVLEAQAKYSTTSFSMQFNNNLRNRSEVAVLGPTSIGSGQINITGTLQAYFNSATTYNKYLNNVASALAIGIIDGSGKGYVFEMPQVKFSQGKRVAGGINTDVIADLNFTAYKEAATGVTMRVARFGY